MKKASPMEHRCRDSGSDGQGFTRKDRKMNLKKIVAAGIAAVCAVSMAACGGSGSGSSKVTDIQYKDIKLGQTGKDIKANLKLFSHRTDMLKNDYPGTTWKQYIAEFNKTYPNIKVTVEANSDYANSAMTRLQGGDWGDIMMIPEVDKSDLSTYFLSYGDVDSVKKSEISEQMAV